MVFKVSRLIIEIQMWIIKGLKIIKYFIKKDWIRCDNCERLKKGLDASIVLVMYVLAL